MIERDNDVPAFGVLRAEALAARACMADVLALTDTEGVMTWQK